MRNRIPPSTDELMWMLAEQRDSAAIDSFCSRYPELRGELLRRVNMVFDLKNSRGERAAHQIIPTFRPGVPPASNAKPWLRWTVAGVGLASVAWATFVATRNFPNKDVERPESTAMVTAPRTNRFEAAGDSGGPAPRPSASVETPPARVEERTPLVDNPVPSVRALDRVITIRLESASLLEALAYISKASKVKIEVGPGLADQLITVDYVRRPALSILQDLGETAGFSVFEQGDAEVLLIPAREDEPTKREEKPNQPQPGASSPDQLPEVGQPKR